MSKLNLETATIEELENECESVMGTLHGHNMIGIICNTVEKDSEKMRQIDSLMNTKCSLLMS